MKTFVKGLILPIFLLSVMGSCLDHKRLDFLEFENENLYKENKEIKQLNDSLYYYLSFLIENDMIKDVEKENQNSMVDGKLEVHKIKTGYDPYNHDRLWLPCVSIMFKNVSGGDITELFTIRAIFIDSKTGEQISSDYDFISGSTPFVNGARKQVTLRSGMGWTRLNNQKVIAHIYLEGDLISTLDIDIEEFDGVIR